jgi:thiamine-phosphate pyrophosphorylase
VSVRSNSPGTRKFPILCYVTDRRSLPLATPSAEFSALLQKIAELARVGVDWVQIREKDLSARKLTALVQETAHCLPAGPGKNPGTTRILINDRVDVALTQSAAGVHLGESCLAVDEVKRLVESQASTRDFLLGVSCHSLEGAKSAAVDGADYIFFGPVFATPSKATFGEPQGVTRLAEVCRSVAIPVLAIGGITLENAATCFTAGAAGIAAIRLFQDAPDPAATVEALRKIAQWQDV